MVECARSKDLAAKSARWTCLSVALVVVLNLDLHLHLGQGRGRGRGRGRGLRLMKSMTRVSMRSDLDMFGLPEARRQGRTIYNCSVDGAVHTRM